MVLKTVLGVPVEMTRTMPGTFSDIMPFRFIVKNRPPVEKYCVAAIHYSDLFPNDSM